MARRLHVTYDGHVFRPDEPVDLVPNAGYWVTVEAECQREREAAQADAGSVEPYPLAEIAHLAMDMGVVDLSARHADYAHGYRKADRGAV